MIPDPGGRSNGRARQRGRRAPIPDPKPTKTENAADGCSARKAPPATRPRSRKALECDPLAANAGRPGLRSQGGADSDQFPDIQAADLPADIVLARLRALRLRITGNGPSWQTTCPAHADTRPSLSLRETDEGVLLAHCWAGCDTADVLAKLGLGLHRLYPSLHALQTNERRPQGSLHFQGGGTTGEITEPTAEECAEWRRCLKGWPAPRYAYNQLAAQLDLPVGSVKALRVGFIVDENCWVFPERDDRGRIVGLMRRYPSGEKRAIGGSMRGLTIPDYGKELPAGPLHLVEGASDAAALHSVGTFAVARPSADGSAAVRHWLVRLLRRVVKREVIVVGEREPSGTGKRAAKLLAQHLRAELNRPVAWALPPRRFKDVREQVINNKWKLGLLIQEE